MERKRYLKIGISSYTDTHTVLGVTGNAEFSGIVTALEFHGDGSNLTNITADAGAYAAVLVLQLCLVTHTLLVLRRMQPLDLQPLKDLLVDQTLRSTILMYQVLLHLKTIFT